MKVVIFCGGMGLRLREHEAQLPKPMIPIGYRPMLWHVMRWYAHFGHTEFILCLGYKADAIKEYFLSYNEALTNDFSSGPTSKTGGSRSSTPASPPTSANDSRRSSASSVTTRCSWPTTPTCSPTRISPR
jgi:NDP-sugar pyrophosphorylase family protein